MVAVVDGDRLRRRRLEGHLAPWLPPDRQAGKPIRGRPHEYVLELSNETMAKDAGKPGGWLVCDVTVSGFRTTPRDRLAIRRPWWIDGRPRGAVNELWPIYI